MIDEVENLEFESALAELETIVKSLESRSTKLKDALISMERAKKLSDFCQEQLNDAENQIRIFEEQVDKGNP